jgi:hypothetical protein
MGLTVRQKIKGKGKRISKKVRDKAAAEAVASKGVLT